MTESILYYLIKCMGFIMRLLPVPAAYWIGRQMGLLYYYYDRKRRRVTMHNLKIAFGKEKSYQEICNIAKESFVKQGQNLIDVLLFPRMSPAKTEKYVEFDGMDHIHNGIKKGKGVIYLAFHAGSIEMASLFGSRLGYPYKVLLNPQPRYPRIHSLLQSYRKRWDISTLFVGKDTMQIVKSLKNNNILSIVIDQGGKEGSLVKFFGRGASMATGSLKMGLKYGVEILFVDIYRKHGPYQHLTVHKPIDFTRTGNLEKDITHQLRISIRLMEDTIRKHPSEYIWFYKIWKYSKEAKIVLLYDEKTGHLRQSEVVAQKIAQALAEREIIAETAKIEVKFKSGSRARLFSLYSIITPFMAHPQKLKYLKWYLTEESYQAVVAADADFIVSCGSSIAGVNRFMSQDINAKSIVILKPGIIPYKRFDLVFLPRHDVKQKKLLKKNIICTQAAPNLINEEYLSRQTEALVQKYTHLKDNFRYKIGVLVGGHAKNVFISKKQARTLIYQLKEVAKEINADILLSSSRRTPPEIEKIFHHELKKHDRCALLILANQENIPEAVGGILGLADIVVTSGDSISMVSEAASSGKPTIVFSPQTHFIVGKNNKHQRFINHLHNNGNILSADVQNIGRGVYDIAKGKIVPKPINDSEVILNAAREVI